MPAWLATSVVVRASTPCSITISSAPSRMALTFALLRSCCGVRRLLGGFIVGLDSHFHVLHVVEHADHDLAHEGSGLFGRTSGHAAVDRARERLGLGWIE